MKLKPPKPKPFNLTTDALESLQVENYALGYFIGQLIVDRCRSATDPAAELAKWKAATAAHGAGLVDEAITKAGTDLFLGTIKTKARLEEIIADVEAELK
jgi:hypothetical protein